MKKIGATVAVILGLCHASEIVLGILEKRITSKADEYLGEDQYGFHRGSGTREAVATIRIMCEKNMTKKLKYVSLLLKSVWPNKMGQANGNIKENRV